MKEIGGYIEFEHYHGKMLHDDAIALNCGRNCISYLFKSKKIKKLKVPYFICDSVINICKREGVEIRYYHIDQNFRPVNLSLDEDEWLYFVNFYGQICNDEIKKYVKLYNRVIVDQTNDYYAEPLTHVDTIYTCRKWFGVSDGAFLYTDSIFNEKIIIDESFDRMKYLLGRFERNAFEFYSEYNANNKYFNDQPIKRMSKLTNNLLHGIDYGFVEERRVSNYEFLHDKLGGINRLNLKPAKFMYPLMVENGNIIRKQLQAQKIYIPILWPTVFDLVASNAIEFQLAENILPLPIDQRYGLDDMEYIVKEVLKCLV